MNNVIRKLFAKDIDEALHEARTDERAKTRADCEREQAEAIARVEGRLTLELKKKEAEVASLALRTQMAEERLKSFEAERQQMREHAVKQRQIMSDLMHVMKDWHERRTEELQPFMRLNAMAVDMERQMLGIEEGR